MGLAGDNLDGGIQFVAIGDNFLAFYKCGGTFAYTSFVLFAALAE
jgi:hypothetical protein